MSKKGMNLVFWGIYVAFASYAIFANWHPSLYQFGGPLGSTKMVVWLALIGLLIYSVYCSTRENLFQTIGVMMKLYWGRQIGADLYLGLVIGFFFIYLNEGTVVALIWALPLLAFANLAMLLYLAINFDTIVSKFLT